MIFHGHKSKNEATFVASFILLMVNMYLHPLSSATAIIMRDIPGVILAQEVNIPAALFCIGIWTIVSIVFAYISLKHRK